MTVLQRSSFISERLGQTQRSRMMSQDGKKLLNGQLEIRGHRLFVSDEFSASEGGTCRCPRTLGGTGVRIMLEVDDADRAVQLAVEAGATVMIPVADMFWGARYGKLIDPFGHEWGINQQVEQLTEAQEVEGARRHFAKQ